MHPTGHQHCTCCKLKSRSTSLITNIGSPRPTGPQLVDAAR